MEWFKGLIVLFSLFLFVGLASGYTNWNNDGSSNEPNDSGGEDCTEMYDGGQWNDIGCGYNHPAVCEVGGEYERISSRTYSEAQSECVSRGGHIVTVNNAEENSYLDNTYGNIWISYKDGREEGGDWFRGGYTNWKDVSGDGEPNNAGGSEDCAEMYSSGVWNDLSCGDPHRGLCEINGGYELTNSMSWSNARDECESRGGHLVTIESSTENQDIDSSYGNVWIGYTDKGNEASWRWVNREPLTPANPDPNEGSSQGTGTVTLSAVFKDPEVLDGTLNFYTQQNGNIGSCSASSGSRCSINFDTSQCTTYNWYTTAEDAGGLTKRSSIWSFTTTGCNSPPNINSDGNGDNLPSPAEATATSPSSGQSTQLKVEVSDPDNEGLDASFYTDNGNFTVIQGNDRWVISPYAGAESGSSWYRPPFSNAERFALAMFRDTANQKDNLIFYNTHSDNNQYADIDLESAPPATVTQADDTGGAGNSHSHDELSLSHEPEGDWAWGSCCTDGGVLEFDNENWEKIVIDPKNVGPSLYVYGSKQKITLDKSQKVKIINGEHIEKDTTVDGTGDTANITWSGLNCGQTHNWFVRVIEDDSQASKTSNKWSFTTICNDAPKILEGPNSLPASSGHSFSVSSLVNDPDGESEIQKCRLEVSDGESNLNTYTVSSPSGGTNTTDAECNFDSINFTDSNWLHTEEVELNLTVIDTNGAENSKITKASFPNHKPRITSLDTTGQTNTNSFTIKALIRPNDGSLSEIRSCSILLQADGRSYSVGTLNSFNSTHLLCKQENIGPNRFEGITSGERIDITVKTADIHGAKISESIMKNVPTGLGYRYSAIIMSQGSTELLTYNVDNPYSFNSRYRTELRNVNATFESTGTDSKTYNLINSGSKSFDIKIAPKDSFTGTKTLKLVTTNQETGLEKVTRIPVKVTDNRPNTVKGLSVPGIGLIQILALIVLTSSFFYWRP